MASQLGNLLQNPSSKHLTPPSNNGESLCFRVESDIMKKAFQYLPYGATQLPVLMSTVVPMVNQNGAYFRQGAIPSTPEHRGYADHVLYKIIAPSLENQGVLNSFLRTMDKPTLGRSVSGTAVVGGY